MELETMHDREFYEGMATEHPVLEQVIAGETTLTNHLDEVVAQFKPTTGFLSTSDGSKFVSHFSGHIKMLAELSDDWIELSNLRKFDIVRYGVYLGGTIPLGYTIGTIVTFLMFLGLPLPAVLLLVGSCGGGGALLYNKLLEKVGEPILKKKRAEMLEPVYGLSSQLDADIDRCFILDHFNSSRERFGQTYHTLEPEEREQVDTQLYGLLGAGGMPGMDELQLNEYRSELLVHEAEQEGDA